MKTAAFISMQIKHSFRIFFSGYAFLLVFISLFSTNAFSQNQSLYFDKGIPQSVMLNPAYVPNILYTFSLPGLSCINFNLRTPFSLHTLNYSKVNDTGYFDLNRLNNKTRKNNILSFDGNIQYLSFGYSLGRLYLSLDYSTKFVFDFRYPKDLISLLYKGNEGFIGRTAKLDNLGANFSHYNEIAIGAAQQVSKSFFVGGRIKYLQGLSNFNTKKSNIRLYTDTTTYWLTGTADIKINMSGPYNVDTFYFNNPSKYMFNFKNPGMGIDLGGIYQRDKHLSFSASIIDLGFISWKNDVKNYSINNPSYLFKGYTADSLSNFSNIDNFDSLLKAMGDSIQGEFDTVKGKSKYRTGLYTKIYLSAEYRFDASNKAGLLYYHRFMGKKMGQNTISALYTHEFGRTLATTLSYSLNNFRNSAIGLGIDLKLGSFQLYLLSDNLGAFFATSRATTAHFNFGINYNISKPVFEIKKGKGRKLTSYVDSDHDGVPDEIDLCPADSGSINADGCPDADNDSTGDKYDDCPHTPGPKYNGGCPVISQRDQKLLTILMDIIEFRKGSDKFNSDAKMYLDDLVSFMIIDKPEILLRIEGHAYDMPTDKENLQLSKARVNNIIKYLTDKGVPPNRISGGWYGSDKPLFNLDDPGTPLRKNRIEMRFFAK